ncbi:MAG: hypothetical protein MJ153_08200 [Clostridia bacterium]|nr:hypothetical protein [Clostridia bacterium]
MSSNGFNRLFGIIFGGVGAFIMIFGIILGIAIDDTIITAIMTPIGFIFFAVGLGFVLSNIFAKKNSNSIIDKGTKYTGKIYSYTDDTTVLVNGSYRVNIKVRYFDKNGVEREAVIPTKFLRGDSSFPIGATIDIYELNGKYTWDKKSVRYESIPREEELMDDKPINSTNFSLSAVRCQSCGASFTGAKGYASRCPYCGAAVNVE